MAKFAVTLGDDRIVDVYAPDEAGALKQATHHETTRIVIATKRGHEIFIPVSHAVSAKKLKD